MNLGRELDLGGKIFCHFSHRVRPRARAKARAKARACRVIVQVRITALQTFPRTLYILNGWVGRKTGSNLSLKAQSKSLMRACSKENEDRSNSIKITYGLCGLCGFQ